MRGLQQVGHAWCLPRPGPWQTSPADGQERGGFCVALSCGLQTPPGPSDQIAQGAGAATKEETRLFSHSAVPVLSGFNQKSASASPSVKSGGLHWVDLQPWGRLQSCPVLGGLGGLPCQERVDEACQTPGACVPCEQCPCTGVTGAGSPVSPCDLILACLGDHRQGLKVR